MAITFLNGFRIGPTELYPFSSFTFTTTGISGSTGPTYNQLMVAYTGSTSGSYFSNPLYFTTGSFNGYQVWTVPQTATYEIEIAGAASGLTNYPTPSGRYTNGAIIKGRVPLIQGQKFVMVVGQRSLNATTAATAYNGIGGGGGSFFVLSGSNTPYLIAGGAGGPGSYSGDVMGQPGILKSGSLNGSGSTATTGSLSRHSAPGGTGSLGGRSHINTASVVSSNLYDGGGGGGFLGNGMRGDGTFIMTALGSHGAGGYAFVSGAVGGFASTTYTPNNATVGGFGGGGGGTPIAGGGGGGYAGGGGSWGSNQPASDGGGGGASYITSSVTSVETSNGLYDGLNTFSGSSITPIGAFNSGSGYIRITKLG
jgi:hypothetical protein